MEFFAEADVFRVRSREQSPEHGAACFERRLAQVVPVHIGQIEQVEDNVVGSLALERLLECAEIGYARFIRYHDLAVVPAGRQSQCFERTAQGQQPGAPVLAIAGEQACARSVAAHQHPIAIELDLEQPAGRLR